MKKKCEKSVPGKKIVKKSVKKVHLEKNSEKKCEKSVPLISSTRRVNLFSAHVVLVFNRRNGKTI